MSFNVTRTESGFFLQISDVHLDPWYSASLGQSCFCSKVPNSIVSKTCEQSADGNMYGQRGCDTPSALLKALLRAASEAEPKEGYDWVLLTGDYVRHRMQTLPEPTAKENMLRVFREVVEEVRQHFPNTAVHHNFGREFHTLGNSDFFPDYGVQVTKPEQEMNPWFSSIEPIFHQDLEGEALQVTGGGTLSTMKASDAFGHGGFFIRQLSDTRFLISLNTVVYSPKAWKGTRCVPDDPFKQFEWLENTLLWLQRAGPHGEPAKGLILGHIPPSIDHFKFEEMWLDKYVETYIKLIERFDHVISGQLFAHIHCNTFRLFPSEKVKHPLFVTSAVSPVYDNNPSFRVWRHEKGELLDYMVHAAELGHVDFGRKYQASSEFGVSTMSSQDWRKQVADKLLTDETLWHRYSVAVWDRATGKAWNQFLNNPTFRVSAVCSVIHMRKSDFDRCVKQHHRRTFLATTVATRLHTHVSIE